MEHIKKKLIKDLPYSKDCKTIPSHSTLREVIDVLKKHKIGSVIAITGDDNTVEGIFTERDYILKIAGTDLDIDSALIEDYMTPDPYTFSLNDIVGKALLKMRLGNFRHLIIVDDDNKLAGVASQRDILNFLLDEMHS